MRGNYTYIYSLSEKLPVLQHREYGAQIWNLAKVRKLHYCDQCRKAFDIGTGMWRPVTNATNRGRRICTDCMLGLTALPLLGAT